MEATEKLRQFLNKCSIAEREENLDVHVEGLLGEYTITYKFVLEKGSSDMVSRFKVLRIFLIFNFV